MKNNLSNLDGHTFKSAYFDEQTLEWIVIFSTGIKLRIDSPWRIILAGDIVLGWQEDRQDSPLTEVREAVDRLNDIPFDQIVKASDLDAQGDLRFHFDNGAELSILSVSNSYESWELSDFSGNIVVAQGGGKIVDFPSK